jgi:Flp pilus assembly protein TadD
LTVWQYFSTQPEVILHYLRLCFWPHPLCLDYMWPVADTWLRIVLPGCVVLALLAFSLLAVRYRPRIGVLGLSFFIILAPTSSVMPIADLAFEHRMYLPLAPVVTLVVLGVYDVIERFLQKQPAKSFVFTVLLLAAVSPLMWRTIERNKDYRDPVRMWTKALAVAPHNYRIHLALGAALGKRGDSQGEREAYLRALRIRPDYDKALGNLAVWHARRGENDKATHYYMRAIRSNPGYGRAYVNYASLLARNGRYEEAIQWYEKAMEVSPHFAILHQNYGTALWRYGRTAEAIDMFREALKLEPGANNSKLRLAWLLATADDAGQRDGDEAIHLATELLAVVGEDYRVLDTLAAAYAEVERFDDAVRTAHRASELATASRRHVSVAEIEGRLALYRQGLPHREKPARSMARARQDQRALGPGHGHHEPRSGARADRQ